MTIAEQYRQKGVQQGREEGQEKALKTVASKLLKEGSSLNRVTRLTGLSRNTVKEMQQTKI
ncbi:MAG: transposase [Gammaproteobacteria bacterium]